MGKLSTTSLVMARTLAVLKGATPAQALAKYPGSAPGAGRALGPGRPVARAGPAAQPGGRRERRHHLLHALGGRLRRRRDAPQLPPRQLSDAPADDSSPLLICGRRCSRWPSPAIGLAAEQGAATTPNAPAETTSTPTPAPEALGDATDRLHWRIRPRARARAGAATGAGAADRLRRAARRDDTPDPGPALAGEHGQRVLARSSRARQVEHRRFAGRVWGNDHRHGGLPAARRPRRPPPALAVDAHAVACRSRLNPRSPACRASSSKASASRRSCCRSTRPPAPPTESPGRCSRPSTRSRPTTAAT